MSSSTPLRRTVLCALTCLVTPQLGRADGTHFHLTQQLAGDASLPGDDFEGDLFGIPMKLNDDSLILGAPGAGTGPTNEDTGAVYFYRLAANGQYVKSQDTFVLPFAGDFISGTILASADDWLWSCIASTSELCSAPKGAPMTKKMRAMQVSKAGAAFELVEREVPEPAVGQVRIRVEACGICHSDAFVKSGGYPGLQLPRIPGHEIAGRVDALGAHVSEWKVGDRVGVGWHGGHCFVCKACRKGLFINCEKAQVTGISYDGGYAEYVVVPHEAVARLPEQLKAVDAGPLLCAGVTTYNSLRNSGARAGDTVAVQGIGGLGHLAIQYAARMGFRTVAISRGADKQELAHQLGAHEYIDTEKVSASEGLNKLGGADLVLATAPNSEAIGSTVDGLKARGKLLIVAAPFEPLSLSAMGLLSGKTVAGWPSGSAFDSEETLAFSALATIRPRVEVFKLEEAEQAFAKVMANRVRFRAVLTP